MVALVALPESDPVKVVALTDVNPLIVVGNDKLMEPDDADAVI